MHELISILTELYTLLDNLRPTLGRNLISAKDWHSADLVISVHQLRKSRASATKL